MFLGELWNLSEGPHEVELSGETFLLTRDDLANTITIEKVSTGQKVTLDYKVKRISKQKYPHVPDLFELTEAICREFSVLRTFLLTWDRKKGSGDVSGKIEEAIKAVLGDEDASIRSPCHQVRVFEYAGDADGLVKDIAAHLRKNEITGTTLAVFPVMASAGTNLKDAIEVL